MEDKQDISHRVWESTIAETFKAYCDAYVEEGLSEESYEFLETILEAHFKYFRSKRRKHESENG